MGLPVVLPHRTDGADRPLLAGGHPHRLGDFRIWKGQNPCGVFARGAAQTGRAGADSRQRTGHRFAALHVRHHAHRRFLFPAGREGRLSRRLYDVQRAAQPAASDLLCGAGADGVADSPALLLPLRRDGRPVGARVLPRQALLQL